MATVLDDHQFELLPSETADSGAAFGIGLAVSCNADGFDPGSADWLVQDQDDPFSGVTRFGRDVRKGPTWTWALHVNKQDEEGALDALADLAEAWAPEDLDGGDVLVMRYKVGGRVRRVYGRPRRFSSPPDNKILGGMIPVTADFKLLDPHYYDDSPQTITVGTAYTSVGGFVFPVTFPALTLPNANYAHWYVSGPLDLQNWTAPDYTDIPTSSLQVGDRFLYPSSHDKFSWDGSTWNYDGSGGIDGTAGQVILMSGGPGSAFVSGRRKTWPIIRINGPVVNPEILATNWNLKLTANIGEGHYIEIDTRPWKRTVTVDGTSFVPGALNPQTRLRDLFLEPGAQSFGMRGISGTGTASATISWYPAYASL